MIQTPRVIPCLLLQHSGLVKTVKFGHPKYLGDPINIVKIFNEKEVDELVILDIAATVEGQRPPFALLEKVAGEAFMPVAYGGGVRNLEDAKAVLALGMEKVIINSWAVEKPEFVRTVAQFAGSQSVVVSIDVKKTFWGKYRVRTRAAKKDTGLDPIDFARRMEANGAGELLLNSIDRDGTQGGYDQELIRQVTREVTIPVVACGGAAGMDDLMEAVRCGAAAAAAGSMFVFHGPHRAVLISYPSRREIETVFGESRTR